MKKIHLALVAMVCITSLELVALLKGIDGQILATVIATLAGLGGFMLGQQTVKRGE